MSDTLLPKAFGQEQETGVLIGPEKSMREPLARGDSSVDYIEDGLYTGDHFLTNQFKVYSGNPYGCLEIATPEYSLPSQAPVWRRASEILLDRMLEFRARAMSDAQDLPIHVRTQHRVVDAAGSRKASHLTAGNDNYSRDIAYQKAVLSYFITRNFVTGAGHVQATDGTLKYSQKVEGLDSYYGYGYGGTVCRVIPSEDGTTRFEDRCGDINISDWATWQRAGGLGLALAIAQVPELEAQLPRLRDPNTKPEQQVIKHNRLHIKPDGTLAAKAHDWRNLDQQQAIAEIAMDKLGDYTELTDEFFKVANALFKFCEDFRKVLKGEATIVSLADRADWAAKMSTILAGIENDRSFGIKRNMVDRRARAADMRYDHKGFVMEGGKKQSERVGTGFRLREKGRLSSMTVGLDVERALVEPDKNTRAHIRWELARKYLVSSIGWKHISVTDRETTVKIKLDDVAQTELSPEILVQLQKIRPKSEVLKPRA